MKMVRSYQQTYIEIEMFIQFCRSKAAENVVEVAPVASGFLGDSSMKYVRMTTYMPYSWRNQPLELHQDFRPTRIVSGELIFDISKMQPEESEWDDEFGNELYVSDSLISQPASQAVDASENKVDEDSKIKALIDTSALDYRSVTSGLETPYLDCLATDSLSYAV